MGQAKNRGSRDDRIQQAKARSSTEAERLGLQRRPLSEIREELGLPADASFLGYAVHIPSSDEFLMEHRDLGHATTVQWAKIPDLAKCFPEFDEAYRLVRPDRGEIVVGIFETDTQFHVSEVL